MRSFSYILFLSLICNFAYGQAIIKGINYDESKVPTELNDKNWRRVTIYASNGGFRRESVDANELYMYLTDKRLMKRSMSCKITLLSPTQIRWYVENDEGPVDMDFIHEFSIPTDLVLTKVK